MNTKWFLMLLNIVAVLAHAQGNEDMPPMVKATQLVGGKPSASQVLPPYVVYRHFLGWVSALDSAAKQKGAGNPHDFAKAFQGPAGLRDSDVEIIRQEAVALSNDLAVLNAKRAASITAFRQNATAAVSSGQLLPATPNEAKQFQLWRTAILIQHYAVLRHKLGDDAASSLDNYLQSQFMQHLSVRALATRVGATAQQRNKQASFSASAK